MSTDRELLELAAKVMGYKTDYLVNKQRATLQPPIDTLMVGSADGSHAYFENSWNPLQYFDQTFKLMAHLGIRICDTLEGCQAWKDDIICSQNGRSEEHLARAITMAAAEIGRAMP